VDFSALHWLLGILALTYVIRSMLGMRLDVASLPTPRSPLDAEQRARLLAVRRRAMRTMFVLFAVAPVCVFFAALLSASETLFWTFLAAACAVIVAGLGFRVRASSIESELKQG